MNPDSLQRRDQFLAMARDLLRLQGQPELIEGENRPRLRLNLVVDGMRCEVFHLEGASDVVLHCHFGLPAHERPGALRTALTFNGQLLRTHAGTFAMRKDRGDMVYSVKLSLDGTTPEQLLESLQATARWAPPWATAH